MKLWKIGVLTIVIALSACLLGGCGSQSSAEVDDSAAQEDEMMNQISDAGEPEETLSMEPFTVLVMGLDSRDGTVEDGPSDSRSDTMMLVHVDPSTYEIGILSIPRDTYAVIDDAGNKINEAHYLYGPEATIDQVEQLTGIRADYYMSTTFVGFEDFIDGLGGVDAYVPIDMDLKDIVNGDKVWLTAGDQHLNGSEALVLARVRKAYENDGDVNRQTNSREMVESLIRKVASDPDQLQACADVLYDTCDTNMDRKAFDGYVKLFSENADSISFVDGTTPYDGGLDESIDMWVVWRDEDTSHACADAINNHTDPQEIVALPERW